MAHKIRRKQTGIFEGHPLGVALRTTLLTGVVVTPLLLGVTMGNYGILFGYRVALAAVFVLAAMAGYTRQLRRVTPGFLFWILIAAAVMGLLQMLPLPLGVARFFAPTTTGLLDAVWPGVVDASARRYSIAPDAPWAASWVAWWLSAAGIYWLGRLLFSGGRRTMALVRILSLSAMLVVVVGLLHLLAGAQRLWGVAEWSHFGGAYGFSSVLRNNNQLGSYLAAGSLGFAGLALYNRSLIHRSHMYILGALLLGFFAVIANSRGVIVVLGAMLPVLWWIDHRGGGHAGPGSRETASLWWFMIPLAVMLAGFWYAAPLLIPDFAGAVAARGVGKFDLWIPALPLLLRQGLTGIGLGTYPFLYFQFADTRPLGFAQTPECMPVDWALSLGLPLGLAVAGAIGYIVFRALWQREKLWRRIGGMLLLFLMIHNLVDYNLTLGAVQLPFFLLLGALSVPGRGKTSATGNGSAARIAKPTAVFGIMAVVLLLTGGYAVTYSQSADWHRMYRFSSMDMPEKEFHRLTQPLLLRHGLDGYLYELMASRYLKPRDPEALQQRADLLNRALILRPNHPETHRRLALTYLRMGKNDLAFFHFARAFEFAGRLPEPQGREFRENLISTELQKLHFSPEQLWSMLPHQRKWTEQLLRSAISEPRYRSGADALLENAKKVYGDQAFIELQAALLARLRNDVPAQKEHLDHAMALAQAAGDPRDTARAAYGLALYYYHLKQFDKARPLFETAVASIGNDAGPWTMYIRMLIDQGHYDAARETARRGFATYPNRYWYGLVLGDIDRARGEVVRALQHYDRALMSARNDREKAVVCRRAAEAALEVDLLHDAQTWVNRFKDIAPRSPAVQTLQDRIDRREATPLPAP